MNLPEYAIAHLAEIAVSGGRRRLDNTERNRPLDRECVFSDAESTDLSASKHLVGRSVRSGPDGVVSVGLVGERFVEERGIDVLLEADDLPVFEVKGVSERRFNTLVGFGKGSAIRPHCHDCVAVFDEAL